MKIFPKLFWEMDTSRDTCPKTHLRRKRGERRESERLGGKRKTKAPGRRKQATTSTAWKLTWASVKRECVSLLQLCHLTNWSQKGTWINFHTNMACLQKQHFGLSLSCSWNNSYCAFGPTLAAMWLVCKPTMKLKSNVQANALFLKMGKLLWHFPQPRFLPR